MSYAKAAPISLSESVALRMDRTGGRTSGFDYLRVLLAMAVVFLHSRAITVGVNHHDFYASPGAGPAHSWWGQPLTWAVLPSFFALSGFLVTGSLLRSKTIVEFIMLRALRIVPALFVETVLAAFILGPIVTDLPLRAYFSDPEFLSYPLNIVGDIHYFLPGVFTHNPIPRYVNQQLWTIPGELMCYLSLVGAALVGLRRVKAVVPLLTIAAIALLSIGDILHPDLSARWTGGGTRVAVNALWLSFLAGVCIYLWREKVPLNLFLFAASLVLSYVLLYDGVYQYLAAVPIAYATVFVGLTDFRRTVITASGDYSYGVYLYGFPTQQTLAYFFPNMPHWGVAFVVSMALALGFAALSWHYVESVVLDYRKEVIKVVHAGLGWVVSRLTPAFRPVSTLLAARRR